MNSSKQYYNEDQLQEIVKNFDYYNSDSNCFYRNSGNVLHRYSQHLSKWILELDKESINIKTNLMRSNLSKRELVDLLLCNKGIKHYDKNTEEAKLAEQREFEEAQGKIKVVVEACGW